MPQYRIRYEEPSSSGTLTNLLIGALAGFAVGMLVAQKSGGIAGITAGVKRRLSELTAEEGTEESVAHRGDDADFEEELDDEEVEDDELDDEGEEADEDGDEALAAESDDDAAMLLEEQVLDAFRTDQTLRDRAIDISAVDDAVIELSGWVDSAAESQLAAAVARQVPGVESVVNRLAVGNGDGIADAPVADEHGTRRKTKKHADDRPGSEERDVTDRHPQ